MITKKARQLAKIEKDIKAVRLSFWVGKIMYGQAREEVEELEKERERLWALED